MVIEAKNRVGLLLDVMGAIAEQRVNISAAHVKTAPGSAVLNLTLDIADLDQLRNVIRRIMRVVGVEKAYRVFRAGK
jgi:GTP pyrophosphokinase